MSKRSFLFPYGITLREGGRIETFPAAEVSFLTQNGEWISLFLVIDSGATISALPSSDAYALGIGATRGTTLSIQGISRQPVKARQHILTARLGDEVIKLPVAFLENDRAPRILGRAGVFGRFSVVFEEHQRRSGFIGRNTRESRAMKILLDELK